MQKYEVGKIIEEFSGRNEGVYFDISDSGASMMVLFNSPTKDEIEQFRSGSSFEIRFTELYGVIVVTVKIGNLSWMDAPYSPHLSNGLTRFEIPTEGGGLSLTLILVDAVSGEIKHIRLLGLSEVFTRKLFGISMEHKANIFNKSEYDLAVNRIFSTYKTSQIVKMSNDYCKINT